MSVRIITAPQPLVTIGDAKQHLLVDHNDDDALIEGFVLAASQWIDGPNGWLKRAICAQTLELAADDFHCIAHRSGLIVLPFEPLIDVVSVVYSADDGTDIIMPTDSYQQISTGIRPAGQSAWPCMASSPEALRIRYRAGYVKSDGRSPPTYSDDPPAPIRVAVLMLVAGWYQTREPAALGATVESLPFAIDTLLSPYRVHL